MKIVFGRFKPLVKIHHIYIIIYIYIIIQALFYVRYGWYAFVTTFRDLAWMVAKIIGKIRGKPIYLEVHWQAFWSMFSAPLDSPLKLYGTQSIDASNFKLGRLGKSPENSENHQKIPKSPSKSSNHYLAGGFKPVLFFHNIWDNPSH